MNTPRWSHPGSRVERRCPVSPKVAVLLALVVAGGFPTVLLGQDPGGSPERRGEPPLGPQVEGAQVQRGRVEGRDESGSGPGNGTAPLTLADAVAMALETHPAVAQAQAAERAAAARLTQAQAGRYPWLTSQASLGVYQEPMVVAPIHAFDPMNPPAFDRNLLQGAVTLGYTVFDGGAREARIRQAEVGEEVERVGGVAAEMDVMVQVSAAYLAILSGQEVLEAAQGQRIALEAEASRVRQFLEEGKAARVDLLRVEAALSRVQASEISARSDLDLARSRLARLTGLSAEAVGEAALAEVGFAVWEPPVKGEVLASARAGSPELSRARQLLVGAAAGVRAAKGSWFPKVEAGGRYNNYGTPSGGHVQEWQGLVQISYPLFSGGSTSGEREQARAEERRAAESLRLAEMRVEDEAETALASLTEARALREALELAAVQSEEVARIEALALEAGAGVQTDFLGAQAELFQARAALAQARHREVLARIQLAQVKGELTLGWIQENMEVVR
jgi:outer membrane protein